jgi:hypothetical protein
MSLILDGTNGVSDIDGTAATPAIRGTDTNTGIFFGSDIIGFSEGGAEVARFNADAQFVAAAGTALLPVITTTGDVNTGIFFPAADTIAFSEGGAEAMRIDSSGNLLVGSTTNPNNVKLFVGGELEISGGGTSYIYGAYIVTTANAANVNVGSSGQLARSTSSLKYKTNVQDATHGLADVLKLRPVTYKGKNDGDKIFGGLIAEEVDAIGLTEFVQYADDGSPDALAYGNMVSLLAKAIQELKATVDAQAARIAVLEAAP